VSYFFLVCFSPLVPFLLPTLPGNMFFIRATILFISTHLNAPTAEGTALLVHGERDPRIPASCPRDTTDRLKQLGNLAPPLLRILEKREHDITLQQDDGFSLPFLRTLTRNPFPSQFTAHWEDMAFPRRYWVELLEKGSGPAEVEARVQDDNRIEIKAHGVKRLRVLL
jgi:hypothetical protein